MRQCGKGSPSLAGHRGPKRQTSEATRRIPKAEIEKWWQIIKAAGVKGK